MEEQRARTRRSFTGKFRHDAVVMVLDDGNAIVDVADRLGVAEPYEGLEPSLLGAATVPESRTTVGA